jgi:hypothetical protein
MIEKRQHPRVLVQDLHAEIYVTSPDLIQTTVLKGTVVDMSHSGIKIKLISVMPSITQQSNITIVLTNINLSTPIKITGMLRYISESKECGIMFSSNTGTSLIDGFVFECVRSRPTSAPDKAETTLKEPQQRLLF